MPNDVGNIRGWRTCNKTCRIRWTKKNHVLQVSCIEIPREIMYCMSYMVRGILVDRGLDGEKFGASRHSLTRKGRQRQIGEWKSQCRQQRMEWINVLAVGTSYVFLFINGNWALLTWKVGGGRSSGSVGCLRPELITITIIPSIVSAGEIITQVNAVQAKPTRRNLGGTCL